MSEQDEIAALKEQVANLTLSKVIADVALTKMQIMHNSRVDEVLALKAHGEGLFEAVNHVIDNLECHRGMYILTQETLDVLQEAHSKAQRQCLANVKADAVGEFVASGVSPNSKAGCIGEFTMTSIQTCPECWQKQDDDCELCNGATDENGQGEIELDIPWTSQKNIFKAMLEFKHEHYLENQGNQSGKN